MEYIVVALAYLLGSVPTGYILGSLAGVDVRHQGSGNVGATNVARVVGKRQGILTLVLDVLKGILPVTAAALIDMSPSIIAVCGASAFLGHLYPIFLKFDGGKGVATALGVILAIAPPVAGILMLLFGLIVVATKWVSLGSIVAAVAAPIMFYVFSLDGSYTTMGAFMALMVVLRHSSNVKRLLSGTEPKFTSNSQ